jgi:hypothetical protein
MEIKIDSKTIYIISLLLTISLSLINKSGVFTKPFFGLEYEDSYIYSDAGRSLNYNYDWSFQPLSVNSCVVGSIANCQSNSTYSGHLIIFPILISVINKILGYSPYNGLYCNFLLSFLLILMVHKIIGLLHPGETWKTYIPLLFLVSTPFINLFNTSGLAETLSSVIVLTFIYSFFKSLNNHFYLKYHLFWISLFLLLLAILIKRENMLLISVAPLSAVIGWFKNKRFTGIKNLLVYISLTVVILIGIHYIINFSQIENQEGKDIGSNTFSIVNTLKILPLFLKSFFNTTYFGFTGLLLVVAVIGLILGPYNEKLILVGLLSLGYIILYSSHYRSYYQVKYGQVSIFETLRYSSNFFPLLCIILSGIGFKLKGGLKHFAVMLIVFYIPFTVYLNYWLRADYYRQEVSNRILPVQQTLGTINKADILITDIPLLFHLFGNDRQIVIDANFATNSAINNYTGKNIYILKKSEDSINEKRYPAYFKLLQSYSLLKIKNIDGGYELLKIIK